MNIVIISGRMVRDPESRTTNNGGSMTTFTVAVDRRGKKDADTNADYVRCVAFGKTADSIATWFVKAKPIMVIGQYHTDQYEKDGEKRTRTEVLVDRFEFVPTDTTERKPAPAGNPFESNTTDDGGFWF